MRAFIWSIPTSRMQTPWRGPAASYVISVDVTLQDIHLAKRRCYHIHLNHCLSHLCGEKQTVWRCDSAMSDGDSMQQRDRLWVQRDMEGYLCRKALVGAGCCVVLFETCSKTLDFVCTLWDLSESYLFVFYNWFFLFIETDQKAFHIPNYLQQEYLNLGIQQPWLIFL